MGNPAVDPSNYTRELVLEKCNHQIADELVGEIQVPYACAVYMGNTQCTEQFKSIVKNMLRAYQWSMEEQKVYANFLKALTAILYHIQCRSRRMIWFTPTTRSFWKNSRAFCCGSSRSSCLPYIASTRATRKRGTSRQF